MLRRCLDCRQTIPDGAQAFWWNASRGPLCVHCQDRPSNRGRLVQPAAVPGHIVPLDEVVEELVFNG